MLQVQVYYYKCRNIITSTNRASSEMLSAPSIIFFDGPYVIDGRTLLIIHSISKMVLKTAEGTQIFGETSRVENFSE